MLLVPSHVLVLKLGYEVLGSPQGVLSFAQLIFQCLGLRSLRREDLLELLNFGVDFAQLIFALHDSLLGGIDGFHDFVQLNFQRFYGLDDLGVLNNGPGPISQGPSSKTSTVNGALFEIHSILLDLVLNLGSQLCPHDPGVEVYDVVYEASVFKKTFDRVPFCVRLPKNPNH